MGEIEERNTTIKSKTKRINNLIGKT